MPDNINHLKLHFHGDLKELLKKADAQRDFVSYPLTRKASIKDIIESMGIPHTEVGGIRTETGEFDFSFVPRDEMLLEIHPLSQRQPPTQPTVLRPDPIPSYRFMVDINVSRLAALLRMAGFDTESVRELPKLDTKQAIAAAASEQGRILLSRDRELMKLRSVMHGRLLRSQIPYRQLQEIVNLYRLLPLAEPFSRCMKCNHLLVPVPKETILSRLEPLTKKYYTIFSQCSHCETIYWRGSHYERMLEILKTGEVSP